MCEGNYQIHELQKDDEYNKNMKVAIIIMVIKTKN